MHRLRCALGRQHADPRGGVVAGDPGFRQGRHIGQVGGTPRRSHTERAQLAALDVREHVVDAGAAHRHPAAEQIRERLRAAFIWHVVQLDPGHRGKQRTQQVLRAAIAGRRVVNRARLGFRQRHQLRDVPGRECDRHHQHIRRRAKIDHHFKIADRIVVELFVQRAADQVRVGGDQQRVTIRRRLGDKLRPDGAARARLVLDGDALLPQVLQLEREDARRRINCAAGGIRHHQFDRVVWVGAGLGDGHSRHQRGGGERKEGLNHSHTLPDFASQAGAFQRHHPIVIEFKRVLISTLFVVIVTTCYISIHPRINRKECHDERRT